MKAQSIDAAVEAEPGAEESASSAPATVEEGQIGSLAEENTPESPKQAFVVALLAHPLHGASPLVRASSRGP